MPVGRILRYTLVCCGLTLVVALLFAGAKVLPFALKSGVALRTVGPLAVATLATAIEVSLLIGTPVGFAAAAALTALVPGGDSALRSEILGRRLPTLAVAAAVWGLLAMVTGSVANVRLAAPGRVANNLVEAARKACDADPSRERGVIPILGGRWECSRPGSPRLVGKFHRANTDAAYTALGMSISDDLTYIEFSGFTLSAPAVSGHTSLRLAAGDAKVRGLLPMTRPSRLGDYGRAAFIAITACLLGVVAAWCTRSTRITRRLAIGVALLMAIASWLTLLHYDDRDIVGSGRYALVPLAGCAIAVLFWWILRHPVAARVLSRSIQGPPSP